MVSPRLLLAALLAAALTATSNARADDLAQQYLRGTTSFGFAFSLGGGSYSFASDGSSATQTIAAASLAVRRTWRGLYVEGGVHGHLGFGGTSRGGQWRDASYGGSVGVGYGFALGERVVLAPGLTLRAARGLGAASHGSQTSEYASDAIGVGVNLPVTVMISRGVYLEPYLAAFLDTAFGADGAASPSVHVGAGHRVGFIF